jgi:hypothetical protein
MSERWKHLYETQARPLREWALDELAGELARELARWPPPGLEWIDEAQDRRLAPELERKELPPQKTLRVALELSRLELLHEVEKIDWFLRSAGAKDELPDALEEASALFLARWLVESCLSLRDATKGKLKRRDLVELLERLEKRILGSKAPLRI